MTTLSLVVSDGTLVPVCDEIRSFFYMFGVTHVAVIPQDGGAAIGRFFGSDCETGVAFALAMNRDRYNVYFTPNVPKPDCGHKPSKAQIDWLRCIFVDIDPPKNGGAFDKEQALARVRCDHPSVVIDSGNGIQAIWRFGEPIAATANNIADVEALNRALVSKYGGDPAATNVDRLLRLPGTVNWPNPKKRERGYVPCMARVL